MAGKYLQDRERQEKISKVTGIVLTVAVHLCIAVFGVFTGLKYIYPPPEEKSILIDFSEDRPLKPRQVKTGTQPRAVNADPKKDIELVQSSEAQHQGTKLNEAPEATTGPDGDVEVPEPPREKEINRRALFHSADNTTDKDTLAAQTAEKVSDALKAGHAQGNTKTGKTSGEPNAKLAGRTVLGTLPNPKFPVQNSGVVVVEIWVDNYGEVKKAVPGAEGTTVTDQKIWNEARKAAMESHFNMDATAPALQKGTITYIFRLR